MTGLTTVWFKEVRDNLRDRRAMFNVLVLGPVLSPVLIFALFWFGAKKEEERAMETLELPVIGAEHAPNLVDYLAQQGVEILPPPENPEEAIRGQEHAVIVRIPDTFGDEWRAGEPATVEVIADQTRRENRSAIDRTRNLIRSWGQTIGQLRLQLRGVPPSLSTPIAIRDVDLSTPQSRMQLAIIFIPYILMLTAFTGGMHVAIDGTAGEKERRSLEPLLINPVPRWQIMTGKMLATLTFAFASVVLTLLALKFSLPYITPGTVAADLNLGFAEVFKMLALILPVGVLGAALLTMLATYAKGFREAQSYMGLVIFIPLIPSMLFMISAPNPTLDAMWIPIYSQNILIGEAVRGEFIPPAWVAASAGSTLLIGIALAIYAATLYNRPRVVFGGG